MIDVERILDDYRNDTTVRYGNSDDSVFITLPFFHTKTDESVAIKVTEQQDGLPVLSDCHTTIDYLEERGVEPDDYSERLEQILKRFGLRRDGNVFRMTVPSADDTYIKLYLGYFIQAISIIANIDI